MPKGGLEVIPVLVAGMTKELAVEGETGGPYADCCVPEAVFDAAEASAGTAAAAVVGATAGAVDEAGVAEAMIDAPAPAPAPAPAAGGEELTAGVASSPSRAVGPTACVADAVTAGAAAVV